MSSPTIQAAPAAPDYSDSYKEGVYADIDTLAIRNQINQAAQLGQKVTYTDPATGAQKTADFTGMGSAEAAKQAAQILTDTNAAVQRQQLDLRKELGVANAEQTAKEVQAADPLAYQTRQKLTDTLAGNLDKPASDIKSSGTLADAYGKLSGLAESAPTNDARLGELYSTTSGLNAKLDDQGQLGVLRTLQSQLAGDTGAAGALSALQGAAAADPGASPTLQALQGAAASDRGASPALTALARQAAMGNATASRQLGDIYTQATRLPENFNDAATAALNPALQSALSDYALGGKLNEAELRDTTNNVRAGQFSRGNFLGDAAAVQEAVAQNATSDAKKQQRLQNLLDIQNQVFGQSDALRNESTAAAQQKIATLAGLTGQQTQQGQTLRGEQAGYATTSADERAANRGEQAGYATTAAAGRATSRAEQGGFATGAADQTTTQRNQLAQLAQQIFGTGNTLQTQQYAQELQKLGLLGNVAGQDFNQNQQAFTTNLNAAGQAMQGANAVAADDRATRTENFGRDQQNLANASAMVLGQPITNQFGALQGAQNGTVGFTPVNYTPVGQLNTGAGTSGTSFAQGNYGTTSNNWATSANIAAQGNPWMSLLGNVAGSAAGAGMAAMI